MEEGQAFSYQFSDGINYFQGKNDSGKTEFYTFLDYMFGASFKLSDKDWYKNTLESAELDFVYNDHEFVITRFLSIIFVITMMTPQKKFALMNIELS